VKAGEINQCVKVSSVKYSEGGRRKEGGEDEGVGREGDVHVHVYIQKREHVHVQVQYLVHIHIMYM
jgi:hypothetical protein